MSGGEPTVHGISPEKSLDIPEISKKSPIFMGSGARAAHELLLANPAFKCRLSTFFPLETSMEIEFANGIDFGGPRYG
jgi:hypothetical protein